MHETRGFGTDGSKQSIGDETHLTAAPSATVSTRRRLDLQSCVQSSEQVHKSASHFNMREVLVPSKNHRKHSKRHLGPVYFILFY